MLFFFFLHTHITNILIDWRLEIQEQSRVVARQTIPRVLTKLMLESKLIWMYFQSNSIPRAPTHRGRHLQSHNRTQIVRFSVDFCAIIWQSEAIVCFAGTTLLLTLTSQVLLWPSPWQPPWFCTLLYQHYETSQGEGPTGLPGPLLPSWIPGKQTHAHIIASYTSWY